MAWSNHVLMGNFALNCALGAVPGVDQPISKTGLMIKTGN